MMRGWKLPALCMAAACLWSAPALAERLEGVLDGKEREWFILRHEGDSTATFTDLGGMHTIDVVGFVDPDSWNSRDSLSISMTLMDGEVTDYDILYLIGTSAMPPLYTSEEAEVRLLLESFDVDGNTARVVGRIEGTLALQATLGEEPSLEEGVDIAVTFDIEASRIEF